MPSISLGSLRSSYSVSRPQLCTLSFIPNHQSELRTDNRFRRHRSTSRSIREHHHLRYKQLEEPGVDDHLAEYASRVFERLGRGGCGGEGFGDYVSVLGVRARGCRAGYCELGGLIHRCWVLSLVNRTWRWGVGELDLTWHCPWR